MGPEWPSTMSLAPGCTVGCGQCSLTGGTVDLLYWNSAASNRLSNYTVTASAAVTAPAAVYAETTIDGVTLTSPTVYFSYDTMFASNWCGFIGGTYTNGIIPINTADLSIMVFDGEDAPLMTPEAFAISDWASLQSLGQSSFLLSIPPEMRSLDPAWASCDMIAFGVWDPPSALQAATTLAGVSTNPGPATTTSASPASSVKPSTAKATPAPSAISTQLESASSTESPALSATTIGSQQSLGGASQATSETQNIVSAGQTDGSGPDQTTVDSTNPTSKAETSDSNPTQTSSDLQKQATTADASGSDPAASSQDPQVVASSAQGSGSDPAVPSQDTQAAASTAQNGGSAQSTAESDPAAAAGTSTAVPGTVNALTILSEAENTQSTSSNDPAVATTALSSGPHQTDNAASTDPTSSAGASGDPSKGTQQTSILTVGSRTVSIVPAAGTTPAQIVNGQTTVAIAAGTPTTIGTQVVSVASGSSAVVVGTGAEAQTVTFSSGSGDSGSGVTFSAVAAQQSVQASEATVGSQAFTAASVAGQSSVVAVVNGGSTVQLTIGGAGTSIGGQSVTALSGGSVSIGSGSSGTVLAAQSAAAATVVSVGSQQYTVAAVGSEASTLVVVNGDSTETLTAGGAAATLGGQQVSAASNGVVVGTGSDASTVRLGSLSGASTAALTLGGQTYTATEQQDGSQTVAVVNGQTLTQGGSAIQVNGLTLSLGSAGLLAGSSTVQFAATTDASAAESIAVLTIGSQTYTATEQQHGTQTVAVVDGQTLTQGGSAIQVNGQTLSFGSGGLLQGTSTLQFAAATGVPTAESTIVFTAGGQTYIATEQQVNGQTIAVVGSQTLTQGGSGIIVNGQTLSLASGGLAEGSSTLPFAAVTSPSIAVATLRIGSQALPVTEELINGQTVAVINGATLSAGGQATVIDGQTVSVGSSGIVEAGPSGSLTVPFANLGSTTSIAAGLVTEAPFTVSGVGYTAYKVSGSSGVHDINGQTFSAGGQAITLPNGAVVSGGSTDIVVDGSTVGLQQTSIPAPEIALFTAANGQTLTAIESIGASTAVIDGSITLSVGGPGTIIAGQSVSLARSGLVVGSSTEPFSALRTTQASATSVTSGVDALATSASTPATATKTKPKKGGAERCWLDRRAFILAVTAAFACVFL